MKAKEDTLGNDHTESDPPAGFKEVEDEVTTTPPACTPDRHRRCSQGRSYSSRCPPTTFGSQFFHFEDPSLRLGGLSICLSVWSRALLIASSRFSCSLGHPALLLYMVLWLEGPGARPLADLARKIGGRAHGKSAAVGVIQRSAKTLETKGFLKRERMRTAKGHADGAGTPHVWTLTPGVMDEVAREGGRSAYA